MVTPEPGGVDPTPLETLLRAYDDVSTRTGLPKIVVLYGETGRGKTYWLQRFYDELAARDEGYWRPGLTPAWPPRFASEVQRERKRVVPRDVDETRSPSFFWAGAAAVEGEGDARADLVSQLHRQWDAVVRERRHRHAFISEVLSATIDALGAVVPPVGMAKVIVDHTRAFAGLIAEETLDPVQRERAALYETFRALGSEWKGTPPTTVVVIDDAPAVLPDVFQVASGLIADSTSWGTIDELFGAPGTDYLPTALPGAVPGPLLYVCTAWEHRLHGAFEDDPFLTWLSEAEALGIELEWVACDQIAAAEAEALLASSLHLPGERVAPILRRLKTDDQGPGTVNQLVLATAIGALTEEMGTWGTDAALAPERVASLSNVPEQFLKDRLAALATEEPGGLHARALVDIAAHHAEAVPVRFLQLAGARAWGEADEQVTEDVQLARAHGLVRRSDGLDAELAADDLIAVDPDVYRYLSQVPPPAAVERLLDDASAGLIGWALDEGLVGEDSILSRTDLSGRPFAAAARRSLRRTEGRSPDSALAATSILQKPELRMEAAAVADDAGVPARALAYAVSMVGALTDADVLAGIEYFRGSWVSREIALRRLSTAPEQGPTERRIVDMLARSESAWSRLAYARALEIAGDGAAATEVLEELATESVIAQLQLAHLLFRLGDSERAHLALTAAADTYPPARMELARRLFADGDYESAIRTAEPLLRERMDFVEVSADSALALGDTGRAIDFLMQASPRFPAAAIRLADLLRTIGEPGRAVPYLAPFVETDQAVAPLLARIHQSEGRLDDAIDVLRRGSAVFPFVSVPLADLYDHVGRPEAAIQALDPWVERDQNVAVAYARRRVLRKQTPALVERFRNSGQVGRNTSVLLARMLLWQDPEFALELLKPWAFANDSEAAQLQIRLLLRLRPEEITEEQLRACRPYSYAKAYRCARNLLVGRNRSALSLVVDRREHPAARRFFSTLFVALADATRPDLMRLVLSWAAAPVAHIAAAELVLTLTLRMERDDPEVNDRAVVRALWDAAGGRAAAAAIYDDLWDWALYEDEGRPFWHALSLFATWTRLPHDDDPRLSRLCNERLRNEAQGDEEAYPVVARMKDHCALAAEIFDDILPPLPWEQPEEGAADLDLTNA